jgi:hypothetical protein
MKKNIVITSIFPPTEAVKSFAQYTDYEVIVVGDKKTPADWYCNNVIFLSVQKQQDLNFSLGSALPYNHYCRKMIGYLYSIKRGAEYIIDTDDDNIPKSFWGFPDFTGTFDAIDPGLGFINIYQLYTKENIWPRGLPLNFIRKDFNLEEKIKVTSNCKIGIWQGLADEDPDVDAIYRLTSDKECIFTERQPVVLSKGTLSPFNTQNTIVCKELFPLLYLPTYVTFRYTDILRGLVAQPIMWLYGYLLGFTNASVVQKRNPHDYFKDFISEIPMYETTELVIETVDKVISISRSLNDNLYNAYKALLEKKVVEEKELTTLELWLNDLNNSR